MEEDIKVKCPWCGFRFIVSGNVPKWTTCFNCVVQFNVRRNKTGIKSFIKRLFRGY